VDINVKDDEGRTPLQYAEMVEGGREDSSGRGFSAYAIEWLKANGGQ